MFALAHAVFIAKLINPWTPMKPVCLEMMTDYGGEIDEMSSGENQTDKMPKSQPASPNRHPIIC
jgi:hypothetical protein